MKTYIIGAAVAAVLGCTSANAQVLGGGLGGSVGGTLSGGMRDIGVMTHGNGSFGADLDAGSLRRNTSDTTGRATNRVRSAADAARDDANSTLTGVRDQGASAAGAVASQAKGAASATRQIDATTSAAGSLASTVDANGGEVSGAMNATHDQQASPLVAPQIDPASVTTLAGAAAANSSVQQIAAQDSPATASTAPTIAQDSKPSLPATKSISGAMDRSAAVETSDATPSEGATATRSPLIGSGTGSAGGNAEVSQQGVSAQGNGSASASLQR